uniref:C-C motif chemokine n=1 Tax=Salarias fasciatus TaxID=181472 RepID=A0A672GWB0_SALFA
MVALTLTSPRAVLQVQPRDAGLRVEPSVHSEEFPWWLASSIEARILQRLNSCCQRHSIGSLPARAIRSYVVQNATDICRINAVIFYTHRGKMFCADPNQKWVQLYLTVLKKLEKMDHDKPVILGH